MKPAVTAQTKAIDRDLLAACRRQLGRNFVSLVAYGSRAGGDDLPDSDYDGFCYVRDAVGVRLNLSGVERRHGVRIGICLRPLWKFMSCVASPEAFARCPNRHTLAALKMGRGRTVGGRDLLRLLPPVSQLLPADWRREAQFDYWLAVLDVPSNVPRREPRRHVGFIIAICDALLRAKGVAVKKRDLPAALKQHHPGFRVVGFLRRALRRRAVWSVIENDKREVKKAGQDMESFLEALRRYVFRNDGSDLTPDEALKWRIEMMQSAKNK